MVSYKPLDARIFGEATSSGLCSSLQTYSAHVGDPGLGGPFNLTHCNCFHILTFSAQPLWYGLYGTAFTYLHHLCQGWADRRTVHYTKWLGALGGWSESAGKTTYQWPQECVTQRDVTRFDHWGTGSGEGPDLFSPASERSIFYLAASVPTYYGEGYVSCASNTKATSLQGWWLL